MSIVGGLHERGILPDADESPLQAKGLPFTTFPPPYLSHHTAVSLDSKGSLLVYGGLVLAKNYHYEQWEVSTHVLEWVPEEMMWFVLHQYPQDGAFLQFWA